MAFTFPASPATNDTYTVGSRTYTWTGSVWEMTGGLITTSQLTDLGVTTAKIDNLSVTAGKIASDAVTTAKIANNAVTVAKIEANPTFTGTVTLPSTTSIGTVSATEIGYVDGVTSAIQTQLDSKLTATTDTTSNRNVIINGAMQVAQRGTSTASITTDGFYTADRWATSITTLGTWTQSVEADAPTGSGFRKSLKMLCTTADASPAAGDLAVITQRLEGQNVQQFLKGTASAKQFAMSFWVKSNTIGTYIAELRDNDNTRSVSASYTISVSGTWEKKTIIFPADATGAFDNDNALSLVINWWLGVGTNFSSGTLQTTWAATVHANRAVGVTNLAAATSNYWQITGIQLEAGAVATPFEFEDIGTTLAKCERYYQKSYNLTVAPATAGAQGSFNSSQNAAASTTGYIGGYVIWRTRFRSSPTVTAYDFASPPNSGKCTRFTLGVGQSDNQNVTTSDVPSESGLLIYSSGTGNNAGIGCHWVASAEL